MNEQDSMLKRVFDKLGNQKTDFLVPKNSTKLKNKEKKEKIFKVDEKNKISSGEGLEITGETGTKYIQYKELPKSRKKYIIKENVFDWNSRDFVWYTLSLYSKKFGHEWWGLKIPAACLETGYIRDKLSLLFGSHNPIIFRDYASFCFKRFIKDLMKKYKKFYFIQLRSDYFMESFYKNYDLQKSIKREFEKQSNWKKVVLLNETIEKSYLVSEEEVVYEYGIIIASNWLITIKGEKKNIIIGRIYDVCLQIYKDNLFNIIKKSTEKWSPYPDWFTFDQIQLDRVLNKIDKKLKINIEFCSEGNLKYDFKFMKGE